MAHPLTQTAQQIIQTLDLVAHPEGGWYRQTWIAQTPPAERASGTAIYYLLENGQTSHWHTVDAVEIWHFYAGAPLILSVTATERGPVTDLLLGPDLAQGQHPQAIVPTGHWQAARSAGDWSLVGCTVSPGFRFDGFHLAAPDFDIPR